MSVNIDWTTMSYARIHIGGPTQNGIVPMARIEGTTVTVSNNSFKVGVAGVYFITYKIAANDVINQTISFKINGVERSGVNLRDMYQATTETYITGLNATDVCTLEVYGGGNFNVYGYSWLNVVRIA